MKASYIIDAIRTPIGNFTGTLSNTRVDDLGALVIKTLMERQSTVDPSQIADVIMGCANQAGEDNRNVARMSALMAGLPISVPAETINRLCASGMTSVVNGSRMIACGDAELVIAGGMENMTRGPWVISKTSKAFGRDAQMHDSSFGWRFINPKLEAMYGSEGMGFTAENLADKYQISRADQDLFAYNSQMKAAKAQQSGRLSEEIIPVSIPRRKQEDLIFSEDEFIRANTSLDVLAKLRPAFRRENGTVTAGNASGLNDGAAAMLLASEDAIKTYNLKPMARVVSSAVVGVEPRIMGIGPVKASQLALKKAGLTLDDMDIIELNEAFSAQALACIRALGLEDTDARINPNGGAIALGHPLGVSGTRILQTAAIELQKQNKRYALCTMCVGVGQGYATIIERV
ncbi:MAG: 3-oxoadipyl-CoA thiolase [Flavobacteriales bacterium]